MMEIIPYKRFYVSSDKITEEMENQLVDAVFKETPEGDIVISEIKVW